jgi:hypothetical protein
MFTPAPFLTSFDTVTLEIQEVKVYADIAFVSDTIQFVRTLLPKPSVDRIACPKPAERKLEGMSDFLKIPISFHLLRASPICARIHVVNKTGRPRDYPQPIELKFIPNLIEGMPITHSIDTLRDASMNYATLLKIGAENVAVVNDMIRQAVKHIAIMMIPVPTPRVYSAACERARGNKGRAAGSLVFQPLESFFQKSAQVLNWIQFDDDEASGVHGIGQDAKGAVATGFQQAGKHMLGAVTGLVMDPIRESRKSKYKHKALGVMAGIGKGLLGVVARPVQAVMDVGTGLTTGVRKAIENERNILSKERGPRALLKRQIILYNHGYARLQEVCLDKHHREFIENVYPSRPHIVVLTRRRLWFINTDAKVMRCCAVAEILTISMNEKLVTVGIEKERVSVGCSSPEEATDLFRRLMSKHSLQNTGIAPD